MRIIIIGAGQVGYELARNLSGKNQDVTVIEKSPEKAYAVSEHLDVMTIEGSGANVTVLDKAGIKNADVVIAVTEIDEVNIIACLVAKRLGVNVTVARVRNDEYFEESQTLIKEQMGIDFVINPEKVSAFEISKMIHFPDASDIEYFARGKVMMVGLTVDEKAEIINQPLRKLSLPPGVIIVGIKRPEKKFIVPHGDDMVRAGDKIYLQGSAAMLRKASWLLQHKHLRVQKVTILGGGMTGYHLASLLESNAKQRPFTVKLVEKEPTRCEELSCQLSRTMILQGDATDLSFFREEEIQDADVLVAATGDYRTNILAALLGKQLGVKKIIAEASAVDYIDIFGKMGIDSIVNPHLITASKILRFAREEDVVNLSILKDENAEMMELILPESAAVTGKTLNAATLPSGMLIGAVVRKGEVIIPNGDTVLKANDRLVIFAVPKVSATLNRYFAAQKLKSSEEKKALLKSQE